MVEDAQSALFQRTWGIYRRMVDSNGMFHREVYGELHRVLVEEVPGPFAFMDVACGDASSTVGALKGTAVATYVGIDTSQPALDLAAGNLQALGCPAKLIRRDFVEALADWSGPVKVIWVGMSMHHLQAPGKLDFMRRARGLLGEDGTFAIWEPTLLPGEDRAGWNDRFNALRPTFWALSDEEFDAFDSHNRAADYQETSETWQRLGLEAGFTSAREAFRSPNDLSRMYVFR